MGFKFYDQSDNLQTKNEINDKFKNVVQRKQTGHNLSDDLSFIIEKYRNFYDVLRLIKLNIFPRFTENLFLKKNIYKNQSPLYLMNHRFKRFCSL